MFTSFGARQFLGFAARPNLRQLLKPCQQRLVASERLFQSSPWALPLARNTATNVSPSRSRVTVTFGGLAAIVGIGLGISNISRPVIQCEASPSPSPAEPPNVPDPLPPPPQSAVNIYELSFGTVAGICAGVFVKKGAKALAFFLGGVFVLLQYFVSMSFVRVDWGRIGTKFENLFYTTDASGNRLAPTISSLWTWLLNFLLADFQPRASFIAGLLLGLRVG
ncbi:hypothetical protein BD410DRAFT_782457 [Rickenella mellea]|uniref:FUN14-domain-containing protein n=1 Tax=Rickenella mellea TaxID=50990 RepID=A0A4Y7QI93_9AGAM|nr:hypothetical protein BD410DRAFT_782457 [Rickenella mellea]